MSDDEEYEILDLTDEQNRSVIQRVLGDLTNASVAKQAVVGGVSGWLSGYLFCKVGKAAAAALGGSLLLLQIAHHQGYITVDWNKVKQGINRAKRKLGQHTNRSLPAIRRNLELVARQNVVLTGGFAGGFLLGIAS